MAKIKKMKEKLEEEQASLNFNGPVFQPAFATQLNLIIDNSLSLQASAMGRLQEEGNTLRKQLMQALRNPSKRFWWHVWGGGMLYLKPPSVFVGCLGCKSLVCTQSRFLI